MTRSRSILLVVVATLAVILDAPSFAQGARGLPDPISSSQLVGMLEAAGASGDDLDALAVPLERYLAGFQTLREGPIEDWLASRRGRGGGVLDAPNADTIKDETNARRQIATRIADLDASLFAELIAAGVPEDVVGLVRDARSRDRSRTLAGRRYTRGLGFEPMEIYAAVREKTDRSPQWALDAMVRDIIRTHDRQRTVRLLTLANEALDIPVERAEAMAALDLAQPDGEGATPEDFERWFAARRDAEREAAADVRELQAAMLAADRSTLERILAATGEETDFADAFRNAWMSEAHAGQFPDRESPASLFEDARAMHDAGELDDETFEAVVAIERSWKPRHRQIEDDLARALETAIKEGARGGMEFGGVFIEVDNGGGDAKRDDVKADVDRLRQARADLDRDVRTRLGEVAPDALASRVKEGDVPQFVIGGDAAEGGAVTFSVAVVADGIDIGDGEPIVIEMDGLDGGAVFMGQGGPAGMSRMANGLARPIDRETFDRICNEIGIDESTASIASTLFLDYQEGWGEIDATLVDEFKEANRGGPFPGMGGRDADDIARAASLRLAVFDGVLALDQTLFRDLSVLVEDLALVEQAAAARRRAASIDAARQGFQPGGGLGIVDLAEVADDALDPATRAAIDDLVAEWSASHTPALEERARAIIANDREMAIAQQAMHQAFERSDAEGNEAVGFAVDETLFAGMQAVQQARGGLERRIAEANTDWTARLVASLNAVSTDAGDAFQLGVDRRAWPQSFRDPRSPEDNFDRALRLEDLDATARVAIDTLRAQWRQDWTDACRRMVTLDRGMPGMDPFSIDPSNFDPAAMQKAQSDRRRLRFERNEINEKAMRELKSLLTPEQQAIVGELPEERRRMLPPGFGDVEMFIGG